MNSEDVIAQINAYLQLCNNSDNLNSRELLSELITIKELYSTAFSPRTIELLDQAIDAAENHDYQSTHKKLIKTLSALKANIEKDANKTW